MRRRRSDPLPGTRDDPLYPDSDGRFMGATDYHTNARCCLLEALTGHFADAPDVYVMSNLVLYYREGDPHSHCDPDILFARKTAGKHPRRSFRVWEEKVVPCVLFELASE